MKTNYKKTIAGAALGFLAAVGIASTASAQIMVPAGAKELNFDVTGYASGTTTLNLADQAPGTPVGSGEDSWGIFQVTSIVASAPTNVLFSDSGTDQYWGIYYGGHDTSVTDLAGDGTAIRYRGVGLTLDIYKITGSSAAAFDNVFSQGIKGRDINNNGTYELSEIDEYLGISNVGTKVYTATSINQYTSLVTFTDLGDFITLALGNLNQDFNNLYTGFTPDRINFRFTGADTIAGAAGGGWTAAIGGDVTLTPVPEPSTYGLMAAGALVGFVAIRRRMQKKATIAA